MQHLNLFLRKLFTEGKLADEILARSTYLEIPRHQTIIKQGEYIKIIPLVVSGRLKVLRKDDSGKEVLLYYIKPGESCALTMASGLLHQQSTIFAETENDTKLLTLPITAFEELLLSFPKLNEFILKTFHTRFNELIHVIDSIMFRTIDFRLVNHLRQMQDGGNKVKITHQELADQLGTAREVVSRLLKRLEKDEKIINHRGYIEIIDLL